MILRFPFRQLVRSTARIELNSELHAGCLLFVLSKSTYAQNLNYGFAKIDGSGAEELLVPSETSLLHDLKKTQEGKALVRVVSLVCGGRRLEMNGHSR